MEDNDTAKAIARYVGTTDWRLPIYNYDESDVMEYYDIPSRYDIPSNPETVTTAKAGEVFYSDPNRVVLYYQNAEISEEYTKVGYFDATEDFVSAVENNPVLENWGNKIILISDGEQDGIRNKKKRDVKAMRYDSEAVIVRNLEDAGCDQDTITDFVEQLRMGNQKDQL